MPRPRTANQRRLSERMQELRRAGKISGTALAQQLGWIQSRVSKIETGKQLATRDDVQAWADALNLSETIRRELVDLADQAASDYQSWLDAFYEQGGGARAQHALGHLDRETTLTRQLVLGLIPGLLQTPAYARDVIRCPGGPSSWVDADEDELDRIIAERLNRQAVLHEPGKQWRFVFAEAVLWTRYGSAATLVEQLHHLVALLEELPTLEVRVVPQTATWPIYPMATFKLRDEMMVTLEQQVGDHTVLDQRQIKAYIDQFDLLAGVALSRRRSIELIRDVAGRIA